MNWRKGPAQGVLDQTFTDGDELLIAVWAEGRWQYDVVAVSADCAGTDESFAYITRLYDTDDSWDLEEVDWWIPLSELHQFHGDHEGKKGQG